MNFIIKLLSIVKQLPAQRLGSRSSAVNNLAPSIQTKSLIEQCKSIFQEGIEEYRRIDKQTHQKSVLDIGFEDYLTSDAIATHTSVNTLKYRILITGSSGFLGSQLAVDMAKKGHLVYALDIRAPSANFQRVIKSSANIIPIKVDISNFEALSKAMEHIAIDYCYHFASVWSYKPGFRELYDRVNVQGTENVLQIASRHKMKRVFFASTVMATSPPASGELLTETSPIDTRLSHPYGWTKAASEQYIKAYCTNPSNPSVTILRIGAIFSDWCELPPLVWMINRWNTYSLLSRVIAGNGTTGIAYLHRDDFTEMMIQCLASHEKMGHCETLIASPSGATSHNDLYPIIRKALGRSGSPFHVPAFIAKIGMPLERIARKMFGLQPPPEEDWMLDLIDKPFSTDASKTQTLLGWKPTRSLESCLEAIIKRSQTHKKLFNTIQACRNAGQINASPTRDSPNPTLSSSKQITKSTKQSPVKRMFSTQAASPKIRPLEPGLLVMKGGLSPHEQQQLSQEILKLGDNKTTGFWKSSLDNTKALNSMPYRGRLSR